MINSHFIKHNNKQQQTTTTTFLQCHSPHPKQFTTP